MYVFPNQNGLQNDVLNVRFSVFFRSAHLALIFIYFLSDFRISRAWLFNTTTYITDSIESECVFSNYESILKENEMLY